MSAASSISRAARGAATCREGPPHRRPARAGRALVTREPASDPSAADRARRRRSRSTSTTRRQLGRESCATRRRRSTGPHGVDRAQRRPRRRDEDTCRSCSSSSRRRSSQRAASCTTPPRPRRARDLVGPRAGQRRDGRRQGEVDDLGGGRPQRGARGRGRRAGRDRPRRVHRPELDDRPRTCSRPPCTSMPARSRSCSPGCRATTSPPRTPSDWSLRARRPARAVRRGRRRDHRRQPARRRRPARSASSSPRATSGCRLAAATHIALVGIEKVVRDWARAAHVLEMLPLASHGKPAPAYTALVTGPAARRGRRPRGAPRRAARRRPLRAARDRLRGGAALHPLRGLPVRVPGLPPDRRPRVRERLPAARSARSSRPRSRALAGDRRACRGCRRCAARASTHAR